MVSTVTYPTSPTNTVQDTSKTWTINQWSGATVTATLSGGGTTTATVSSNTANTLTVGAWSNGTPTIGNPYTMATSGGYVYTSGNGVLSITASQSGPYAGVSLFTDPGLQNPAFTTCDATAKAVICVAGNGGNIGGTVYVPKGTVDLQGGGSSGVLTVAGYLVIRDLIMTGSETLNVTGPDKNNASCDYFDDPVERFN